MKIVISTNMNGIGLETDYRILRRVLEAQGHDVQGLQYDNPAPSEKFDLGIWLEVINEQWKKVADRWWIFCNPEWTRPESVRPIQRNCEKVLAKTRDGERSLRTIFNNVEYTGFMAEDRRIESIGKIDRVLHVGGNSGFRGTNELLACYREYRYYCDRPLPELTCITNSKMVDTEPTPGVVFHKRVSDAELTVLQNSHRFHVMPSSYEGFGQALHESQSVGAVLLTTGAGPMHELGAPFEISAVPGKPYNLGTLYEVSICDLRERIPEMLSQPSHEIAKMGVEARARFEQGNKAFTVALRKALEPSVSVSVPSGSPGAGERPRIAVLGNLRPAHSTENDLVWSLKDLGYPVSMFQEDEDTTEQILKGAKECALLIYIHTHGWATPGKMSLDELWEALSHAGTKTASFHLDRYWGLNESDGREDRIGTHPFWRVRNGVYTADGGNQQRFNERGVAHRWLPPGIIKRDTIPGEYRKDLAVDVGFVGAEGYHPEWPWRGQLLQTLREVYKDRFRLFQGFRGKDLNDLMASVKVFVGDCCFAGQPKYWSDRLPEHCGRGGFLLHPQVEGMCIPTATFTPCDIHNLLDRIDYFLENEEERESIRKAAWLHTKAHDTYSNRMQKLLGYCGL